MKKHWIKQLAFLSAIATLLLSGCEQTPDPVMPVRLPGSQLSDFYGALAETIPPEAIPETTAPVELPLQTEAALSSLPQTHREPEFYRQQADGSPAFGWYADPDGTIGFCDESGYLITGFAIIGDYRYLFTAQGDICTGVYYDTDGSIYQFTPEGHQYLDCVAKDGDYYYYYDATGRRVTGMFYFSDGSIGMTDSEGHLLIGSHLIDGNVYTFSATGKLRRSVDASKPMIALTYDDGPTPAITSGILSTLRENNAVATFFVLGSSIGNSPTTIQEIDASGCEIGNHTYNHTDITSIDAASIQQELSAASATIQTLVENRPLIMRPPSGVYDQRSCSDVAAVEDGYPLITWSVDTLDSQHNDAATTVQVILTQVTDGSIIRMHDTQASTLLATQIVVPELVAMGYQLVTVSELAAARGGMTAGSVYDSFSPDTPAVSTSIPPATEAASEMQPQLIYQLPSA